MFNPVHYRKTWESIGKPFDPPAIQRLEAPWSAISLLKSILGATMGIIPPGAVGTEQLAQGAVTFDKIRTVAGFTLVGRALSFSGEVHEVFVDQNGLVFDGINKLMLAPAVGDVTAPIGTRTFTLANSVVGDNNIKPFSIDLTSKAAIATPNKLWGTTGSGVTFQWSSGTAVLFENNTIHVVTGPGGVQPYDPGLTQLAAATTPAMYWLSAPDNWQPVTIGAGLIFSGGVLTAAGGGAGGGLGVSGQVQPNQIATFTSAVGDFVRGTNLPPEIIMAGDNMQFTGNLAALAGLTGTNTLYYRISDLGWGPVTFAPVFTFNGTLDLAPGLLRNLHTLNPTADTYPLFHGNDIVTAEPISEFSQVVITSPDAAAFRTAIGAGTPYMLDPDLASIAAITATNSLIYRVSANTWAPVTIGANLLFTGGTLSATSTAGGNVSAVGSPAPNTLAFWTSGTTIDDAALGGGLSFAAGTLSLDPDLVSLSQITGVGIPFHTAPDTWGLTVVTGGLAISGNSLIISHVNLNAFMGLMGLADRLPYFSSATTMALATFTGFARTLVAAADAAAARTILGVDASGSAQPLDADLTSLAAASATNSMYYRSAADTWAPVTVGANLTFSGGVLAATGGGTGSGDVTSTGAGFSTATLAGYADTTGDVIRAVTFPTEGFGLVGTQIVLNNDLAALEALAGTNTLYYRAAANTWSPVTFSTGLSFAGGAISLGTNLVALQALTGAANQLPYFTSVSAMALTTLTSFSRTLLAANDAAAWKGLLAYQSHHLNLDALSALISAADLVPYFTGASTMNTFTVPAAMRTALNASTTGVFLTNIGAQPLDPDLAAIAGLTGTNTIYYRSAADTWSAVSIGAGLLFTGGQLSATADTTGLAPLASPAFTGVPTAPTAATATNTTQIATCAYVQANVVNLQPLDGDLTSLAAAASIGDIYYRQGTNSWAPVTVGTGLSFTGGVLAATSAGAGDVTSSGAGFTTNTLAGYADTTGDVIRAITMPAAGLTISGSALTLADDLAALEALSGTNTIYRRSGTNTWSAITYGTGINLNASGQLFVHANLQALALLGPGPQAGDGMYWSSTTALATYPTTIFSRGIMSSANAADFRSAIGAGDAVKSAQNIFTNTNWFTQPQVFSPNTTYSSGAPLQVHRVDANADFETTNWSTNVGYLPRFVMRKSNSGVIGTNTANAAGLVGSQMGQIIFALDHGAGFVIGGMMTCTNAQPFNSTFNPTRFGFYTCSPIDGDGLQERFFVDAYGRFIVGKGGAASPYLHGMQLIGTTDYATVMSFDRYSADQWAGGIYLQKSRGTTIGQMVPVQAGDQIGGIAMLGVDSNNQHITAISIVGYCIATPSAGAVPSKLTINAHGTTVFEGSAAGVRLKGTNTNDNALAGDVGEYPTPVTFSGFSVGASLTLDVASISLSAGDWEVWTQGYISSTPGSTFVLGLNTVSMTLPAVTGQRWNGSLAAGASVAAAIRYRFSLSATTTVYFIAQAGGSAVALTGAMFARRMR